MKVKSSVVSPILLMEAPEEKSNMLEHVFDGTAVPKNIQTEYPNRLLIAIVCCRGIIHLEVLMP